MTGEVDGMNQGVNPRDVMHNYLNERSVIFNEEMVGGRERVTADKERVLLGVWTEIRLLGLLFGCKNFVGKKEVYIQCVRWP